MTNELKESTLNWMYDKPTFEEVKGKTVHFQFIANKPPETFSNSKRILTPGDYDVVFEDNDYFRFLRFAIIAEPEIELAELWGVKARIVKTVDMKPEDLPFYFADYENGEGIIISMPYSNTRSEAITAWNKIAKALREVVL